VRKGTTQAIDGVRGKQDRSAFIRDAIGKEIARRIARKQPKAKGDKP